MTITLEMPELDERSKVALAFYDTNLKSILEPEQNGKGIAIHPETNDYALGNTPFLAARTLRERHPGTTVIQFKIGLKPDYAMTARYMAGLLPKHSVSEE